MLLAAIKKVKTKQRASVLKIKFTHNYSTRSCFLLIQHFSCKKCLFLSLEVRKIKKYILTACNVMLFGPEGVYTLRNHGETGNCSVLAVSPATVQVLDLNVGQTIKKGRLIEMETGTIHHVSI